LSALAGRHSPSAARPNTAAPSHPPALGIQMKLRMKIRFRKQVVL
jgi:hypothetical protein